MESTAEVCPTFVLAQVKQLGGGTGTSLPPDIASSMIGIDFVRDLFAARGPTARDIMVYWLALVLAVGTFAPVYRLLRSRHCLALSAIGDSEAAAESTGVDVFRTKFLIYVLTAAATGMVGVLIFLQKARISPDAAFSLIDWTAYVIFIVVIGGIGNDGRSGHRRRDLLSSAILSGGARVLVSDPARRTRHHSHAVCSCRRLGSDLTLPRPQPVSGAAKADRRNLWREGRGNNDRNGQPVTRASFLCARHHPRLVRLGGGSA